MFLLYEMTEDGETLNHWAPILHRLSKRRGAPVTIPRPQHVTYSFCVSGRHIDVDDVFTDGRWETTLVGTSDCNRRSHDNHGITQKAPFVNYKDLPEAIRAIIRKTRPTILQRVKHFFASA